MNTDGLAKLYDTLTPRERLPLILAAAARGDEIEKQRLSTSAPKIAFEVTDYFGLAQALGEAIEFHLLTLLELAAQFWQWWGLWMAHKLPRRREAHPKQHERGKAKAAQVEACQLGCMVGFFAYRFTAHLDGWRQFCVEMHMDPQFQLNFMPGWDMIARTEKRARNLAFTPEDAAMFLWSESVDPVGVESQEDQVLHVESSKGLAQVWHEFLDKREQWWGSSEDGGSAAPRLHGKTQWEIAQQFECNQVPAGNDLAPIRKAFTRRDFDAKTAEARAEFDGLAAEAWAAWECSCRYVEAAHQRTESGGRQAGDAGPVLVRGFIEKTTKRQAGDPRFLEQLFDWIERRQQMLSLGKGTPVKVNQTAINWDDLCILDRPETDPFEEAIAQAVLPGPGAASVISAAAFSALGTSANGKP